MSSVVTSCGVVDHRGMRSASCGRATRGFIRTLKSYNNLLDIGVRILIIPGRAPPSYPCAVFGAVARASRPCERRDRFSDHVPCPLRRRETNPFAFPRRATKCDVSRDVALLIFAPSSGSKWTETEQNGTKRNISEHEPRFPLLHFHTADLPPKRRTEMHHRAP